MSTESVQTLSGMAIEVLQLINKSHEIIDDLYGVGEEKRVPSSVISSMGIISEVMDRVHSLNERLQGIKSQIGFL